MIRGQNGHTAHQFEVVAGVITRPLYSNKHLFIIDGAPGIWRQVADPGVSDPSDRGIVYAGFGGKKIALTPDVLVNAEFELAGINWHLSAPCPVELVNAIATAKELAAKNPPTLLTAAAAEAGDEAAAAAVARVGGVDTQTAPKVRRRAAGSVITSSSPEFQIRDPETGELAPTSAAAIPAATGPVTPAVPAAEAPVSPAGETVSAETGFAPADEFEV